LETLAVILVASLTFHLIEKPLREKIIAWFHTPGKVPAAPTPDLP
jgi:peptidoglycan/LPS O-acetylase OafA/YrhL